MLRTYLTKIRAVDPNAPERGVITWSGPNIQAISWGMAEKYLQENKMGYCTIEGELVQTIPVDKKGNPIWDQATDHDYHLN